MVKAHECAAPQEGDDIVWTKGKLLEVEGKLFGGNTGIGQTPIRRALLVLPKRRRSRWLRCNNSRFQQRRCSAVFYHEAGQADHSACSPELQRECGVLQRRFYQRSGSSQQREHRRPKVHPIHDRRSTSVMKAVVKSTSNGGTLHGQSRAEFCGNANQGVETCAYSYGKKHGVESGVEPGLLNGGHESLSTREGIVRSCEQSQTQMLQTRDVQ